MCHCCDNHFCVDCTSTTECSGRDCYPRILSKECVIQCCFGCKKAFCIECDLCECDDCGKKFCDDCHPTSGVIACESCSDLFCDECNEKKGVNTIQSCEECEDIGCCGACRVFWCHKENSRENSCTECIKLAAPFLLEESKKFRQEIQKSWEDEVRQVRQEKKKIDYVEAMKEERKKHADERNVLKDQNEALRDQIEALNDQVKELQEQVKALTTCDATAVMRQKE